MTPNEDGPQTSPLEALRRIYGDAAWRNAVGKEIRILLATEEGRNIVLTFANGLQEWAESQLRVVGHVADESGRCGGCSCGGHRVSLSVLCDTARPDWGYIT